MKSARLLPSIVLLLLVISFGVISNAYSQDLFRDMDQVKRDISDLKNEVSQLKTLVYTLREAVLKSGTSQEQEAAEKTPSKEQQPPQTKPASPADEKEITRVACQAVGKFFKDVDASLSLSDDTAAQAKMREALRNMNSALREYSQTHRVSKLLGIYQGLAWDTYVAVELRGSIQGNRDFLDALNKHRQKYSETCPGE
jgi:hypothetical protein